MATLTFELVSPERVLYTGEIDSVVVPGADGDFQVFAGHAPVMTTLNAGVVTVAAAGGARRLFVRGGFAEVSASRVTLLAEQAVDVADVSADSVAKQIADAEQALSSAKDDATRMLAQTSLDGLKALQRAIAH